LQQRSQLLNVIPDILAQRQRLYDALRLHSTLTVWPSAANFLYVRSTQPDTATLFQRLNQLGTHVRHTGGGLRITVGTPEENNRTLAHIADILG
jgi:histidinol-phosphate aminotransferase